MRQLLFYRSEGVAQRITVQFRISNSTNLT